MEGVSSLLADGFTPERTLMFTFGHDEELQGTKGAGEAGRCAALRTRCSSDGDSSGSASGGTGGAGMSYCHPRALQRSGIHRL